MKNITLLVSFLFLTACGGGSSDKKESSPNTINLIGAWTASGKLSACPNISSSYLAEFKDTNSNGKLNSWIRYTGNLIDTDTCTLVPFSTETLDVSASDTNNTVTKSELATFIKKVSSAYYGIDIDDITVTVNKFTTSEFKYTTSVTVDNVTESETATFSK